MPDQKVVHHLQSHSHMLYIHAQSESSPSLTIPYFICTGHMNAHLLHYRNVAYSVAYVCAWLNNLRVYGWVGKGVRMMYVPIHTD